MRDTKPWSVYLITLTLAVAGPALAGNGVWTSTYPYGGHIGGQGMTLDPATGRLEIVPNERGIYASIDGASTWQSLTDDAWDLPFRPLWGVFRGLDSTLYVLAWQGPRRLYRSLDDGATWSAAEGLGEDLVVLAFDPTDADVIYAGTSDGKVFRTTDGTASWSQVGAGLPGDEIRSLEVDPLTPANVYLGTAGSGIFKSTDSGASFLGINNGTPLTWVEDILVDPTDPLKVYAADNGDPDGKGVFKSVDGGASWTGPFGTIELGGWTQTLLAFDPSDTTTLYAVSWGSMSKSTDSGATWSSTTVDPSTQTTVVIVDPSTPTTVYAGTSGEGVWKSTDGGATWSESNTGIQARNFPVSRSQSLHFDVNTSGLIYTGGQIGGFRSTDNGASWSRMNLANQISSLATYPGDTDGVWAWEGQLWRSTDGGVSWADGSNGAFCCFQEGDVALHPTDPLTLYVASGNPWHIYAQGIYKTIDGGVTWNPMNNGLPSPERVYTLTVDPNDGNTVYAAMNGWWWGGGDPSGVFKTTDGGANWFQLGGGLPDPIGVNQILVDPGDSNLVFLAAEGDGLYQSTDAGSSWTKLLNANTLSVAVDPGDSNIVYTSTWTGPGMFRSVDGGDIWAAVVNGLPHEISASAIVVDPANPNRLLLGTTGGAWEYTFSGTVELTVTNFDDSGGGSLRDAILQSNQDGVPNVITFAPWMSGGGIWLSSGLPPMTEGSTTIDGDLDGDCAPDIGIHGDGGFPEAILHLSSDNNVLRGLAVTEGGYDALYISGAHNNLVECNYFGPDLSGTGGPGNQVGIWIDGASTDNTIGPGNVIAVNRAQGLTMNDGIDDRYPDFSGLTADATGLFPVIDFSSGDFCGPFTSADAQTPVDGDGAGFIESFGARFTGTVNVDTDGDYTFDFSELDDSARVLVDAALVVDGGGCCPPNSGNIYLTAGDHPIEVDYRQGPGGARLLMEISGPGTASLSYGGQPGLNGELFQMRLGTERNTITQNSFFDNGDLAIHLACGPRPNDPGDLDKGPNTLLNTPEFTGKTDHGGGSFTVDGTATDGATVEIFTLAADPSGHGEGRDFLGSGVATGGVFSIGIVLPPDNWAVTATATDTSGNTSEFSANYELLAHPIAVVNALDSGPGSLRDAIEQANSDGVTTEISIDPGLAGQTIHLVSPLPNWTEDNTSLDADLGGDCIPDLELDGSVAGWGSGLQIDSSGNLVRGLVINSFPDDGIHIGSDTQNNVIECNYVGTEPDGATAASNGSVGVNVVSGLDHLIFQNVIAFNVEGIVVQEVSLDAYPDFAGLTPDYVGVFPVMEFNDGCGAFQSADAITPTDGSGNAFNDNFGARFTGNLNVDNSDNYDIELQDLDDNARILVDGGEIANGCCGYAGATTWLDAGDHTFEIDFLEGGGAAGFRLEINGPGTAGLDFGGSPGLQGELFQLRRPSERNTITQNSIFGNGGPGISFYWNCGPTQNDPGDVDVGPNTLLNFPEFTSSVDHGAGSYTVDGTAPPDSTVEFFGADDDPSGHGEGKEYLGSVVVAPDGSFSYTLGLPAEYSSFTATATDLAGNTSEFSENFGVKAPDEINLGWTSGYEGDTVEVPVYVRDLAATLLGVDRPAGNRIQGFTFQVQFEPSSSIQAASAYRSGITAGLSPLFDTFVTTGSTIIYLASFDEATNLVPLTLDGPGPGDEVARLVFTLDPNAPPIQVQLTLLGGTVLSNQAGTLTETEGPRLTLGGGWIDVRTRAATQAWAIAQSSSEIRIDWSDPQADETGFRVERSADSASWSTIATLGPDDTVYSDGGLPPAALFYYRVVAFNGGADAPASNVAWAETFPATAAKTCVTQVSDDHSWTRFPTPAFNGTMWASTYQERNGSSNDEVYFQFVDGWGNLTGAQVQLSYGDMHSQYPALRWNGAHFGAVWWEHMRGPGGENTSNGYFTLLDANGQILRRGVRLFDDAPTGGLNDDLDWALDWDGGGWGQFHPSFFSPSDSNLGYWRFSEDGELLTGPVQISFTPGTEGNVSTAWSGVEYGVAWVHNDGGTSEILFQRVLTDGSLPAPAETVWQNGPGEEAYYSDVVWNGSGWAVAWTVVPPDGTWNSYVRLFAADGTPLGPAGKVSHDEDPDFPGQGLPIYEDSPELLPRPGGGYVCYVSAFTFLSGAYEVARYELDANGDRVGQRTILSATDGRISMWPRAADDGSNDLVLYDDHDQGTQEIGSVVVAPDGAIVSGPGDMTCCHSPGDTYYYDTATVAGTVPVMDGFLVGWRDKQLGYLQPYVQLFDGDGNPAAGYRPLTGRDINGLPGFEGLGSTFAAAWKDGAGTIVFDLYDAFGSGSVLGGEIEVAYDTGGRGAVDLAFSGEVFGLVYFDGYDVVLKRVDPGGGVIEPPTVIADTGRQIPMVKWVGAGWAVIWRGPGSYLDYALVDRYGSVVAGPTQILANPVAGSRYSLEWGDGVLGLTWVDAVDGGTYFNILDLNGSPTLPDVLVMGTTAYTGFPQLYWAGDRFRLVRGGCSAGGTDEDCIYEDEILTDGTLISGVRQLTNGSSPGFVAYNGATSAILWGQRREVYFETSACLDDVTPPPCPDLGVSFDDVSVLLDWTTVDDPESAIWRYNLYRDGIMLAELFPWTQHFEDGGWRQNVTHTYEVRGLNGAYRESAGCPVSSFSTTAGDGNGDGVVDLADIIYLINYLFAGGAPPQGDADANGDGVVDIADLFYLINHVFGGGPPPHLWSAAGSDVLALGTAQSWSGHRVDVPIYLRDRSGTPLDENSGFNGGIQSFAFQVSFAPDEVEAVEAFVPGGASAGFRPTFPIVRSTADHAVVIASFDETVAPLALSLDAPAPGDLVGWLRLRLRNPLATGSVVHLGLDPIAGLTNHDATVSESVARGNLVVVGGSVEILDPYLFADAFESGDTKAWTRAVGQR